MIELYGNKLWNDYTDNSYKNVLIAREENLDKIILSLESAGLNYCAYIYEGVAHIATNRRDYDKILRLSLPLVSVQNSNKEHHPQGFYLGNIEYKNIVNKRYGNFSRDYALKLAQRLDENNISYSCRIQGGRATITVSEKDHDYLIQLSSSLSKQLAIFDSHEEIKIDVSNADKLQLTDSINLDKSKFDFNRLNDYLKDKLTYSIIETSDAIMVNCNSINKLQPILDELSLPKEFLELIDSLDYNKEQTLAFYNVYNYLKDNVSNDNILNIASDYFTGTNVYSANMISELSELFLDTYKGLSDVEIMIADTTSLNNKKSDFDKTVRLYNIAKNKHYSQEQLDCIISMVDANMSDLLISLLDESFTVENMNSYLQQFKSYSYHGLIDVIAQVKNRTPQEIKNAISDGTYQSLNSVPFPEIVDRPKNDSVENVIETTNNDVEVDNENISIEEVTEPEIVSEEPVDEVIESTTDNEITETKLTDEQPVNEVNEKDYTFDYSFLSRLKSDCKYVIDHQISNPRWSLWGITVEKHIEEMRKVYNSFPDDKKPQWITMSDIDSYEKTMLSLVNGVKVKEEKVEEQTQKEIQEQVQNKPLEQPQEEQSSKNILGKSLEIDGTEFIVDSISGQDVSLRDTSMATIYPIFRSEKLSKINRLLKEQENTRDEKINNVIIDEPEEVIRDNETNVTVNKDNDKSKSNQQQNNYRISDTGDNILGLKTRFRHNVEAIKTLQLIESENRVATSKEQKILSDYTGWGGLQNAFDDNLPNWQNEYTELKDLLSNSEYESARSSVLDAYYTDNTVIDSIYKILDNLNFTGGDILEPACGTGRFFGRMPNSLSKKSHLYGVEKDSLSGRIATQLYPNANISVTGYENTRFQNDSIDVAISNIPFGDFSVNDRAYNNLHLKIHDYFFAKTLDKVREGGLVVFVTSTGTLDKSNSLFRQYLSERADLLGAIRLPNTAFKSVGTKTATDIIVLQKNTQLNKEKANWIDLSETSDGLPINNYFTEHPDMVLGNVVVNHQYGRDDSTTVIPFENSELSELLDNAVKHFSGQITKSIKKNEPLLFNSSEVNLPADLRAESFFVDKGKVYFYGVDSKKELNVFPAFNILSAKYRSENSLNKIKQLIDIRDTVRELLDEQQNNTGNDSRISELQKELNTKYDKFYNKYGLIHSRKNKVLFVKDNSYSLLSSLEAKIDKDKLIEKSDIFTKRTIKKAETVKSVDTAIEALSVSIANHGFVDLDFMAELCNKPKDVIIENLDGEIYPVPNSETEEITYQTASEYLSGDIYAKLDIAKECAKTNPLFVDNVVALEKSIPEPLKAGDIDIKIGATWIDPKYYQDFMYETFKTPYYNRNSYSNSKIVVEYSPVINRWNITNKNDDRSVTVTKEYGTENLNAYVLLERALNLGECKVYKDKLDDRGLPVLDDKGRTIRVVDLDKTRLAQRKQNLIKREFENWIFKDPQRRTDLVSQYNRQFNCIKPREYDGSNLIFPEMNANISLKPHQKDAVAQAIYGGNTLFAHSVGAGKTFEMIATAMESKRLGFCNKSLFAVPNHLTEQIGDDFLKLYPNANILVATKSDFERKNKQVLLSKIATGNYDAVIIGHTQLKSLPLSPDREREMYQQQIDDIIEGIAELKRHEGSNFQIKAMEKTRKSLEKKLADLKNNQNENTVYFEELGIDKLFVDEAHEFKNLFSTTKLTNVSGISSRPSQRATDLFMKCRYLDEITGGKGVVFATGTPVSNSITELHTMMRYLEYDYLNSHNNMQNFDNWVSNFGIQKTEYELDPTGTKFKEKTRIAEYTNMPELVTMFKQCASVRTADTLNLDVPECEMHIVNCEPTELQEALVQELADRAEDVNSGAVDPSVDNMLKITSDGRKVGLDPRLINPDFEDDPNTKLNACVDNVFKIYEETKEDKLTQIIFSDLGVPKSNSKTKSDDTKSIGEIDSLEESGEFSVYDDIKAKLIAKGVDEKEIAFIHDAKTEVQKAELFDKVRQGKVRIFIGSTSKMGTGTNVQDRVVALHDLDVPWRPSDLEQRKGRMVRQGNINKNVHLYRYVTKGTFDAYSYQLLEKKQKFIGQIMTSKEPARRCTDVDQSALTYSEIKALCTGDERIKEKLTLDNRVKELQTYQSEYNNTRYELEDKVKNYNGERKKICDHMDNIKIDVENSNVIPRDKYNNIVFKATVDGVEYDDMSEASKLLADKTSSIKGENHRGNLTKQGSTIHFGEIYGFKVDISNVGYNSDDFVAKVHGKDTYTLELGVSPLVNLNKIVNGIANINVIYNEQEHKLNRLDLDYKSSQKLLAKPFEYAQELKDKSERLEQLTDELNAEAVALKNSGVKKIRTNLFDKKLILNPKSNKTVDRNHAREKATALSLA